MKTAITALTCATALTASALTLAGSPAQGAAVDAVRGTQSASLSISPGIVQNGTRIANPVNAHVAGGVKVSPARKGRLVTIERRTSLIGPWSTVLKGRTDGSGVYRFKADAAKGSTPYQYRAIAAGTSTLPRAIAPTRSVADWAVKFDDQFRGTSLNTAKWGYRNLGVREGSRKHAESSTKAVSVSGGALHLAVKKNPARSGYYLNGHIGTQGKFDYTYGVSAARIKFQMRRGQHGAFWMQPASRTALYGSAANTGAEVDVAEFFGKGYPDGGMAHFLYSYPRAGTTNKYGKVFPGAAKALAGKTDSWWSRYHVFSVDWTSSGYVFKIDGTITWRTSKAISKRPQFLILSLLSSDWELPKLDRSKLPSDMRVDWVRVWQR